MTQNDTTSGNYAPDLGGLSLAQADEQAFCTGTASERLPDLAFRMMTFALPCVMAVSCGLQTSARRGRMSSTLVTSRSAMDLLGFWSYVHANDEVDMGRVTQLAIDIVGHYRAITGESIRLFLDRDDLHWGDQWREQVAEALSNVAFFIPVVTPRYFQRVESRRVD